jgi:hypothetical protein
MMDDLTKYRLAGDFTIDFAPIIDAALIARR